MAHTAAVAGSQVTFMGLCRDTLSQEPVVRGRAAARDQLDPPDPRDLLVLPAAARCVVIHRDFEHKARPAGHHRGEAGPSDGPFLRVAAVA
eukprot:gene7617-biopygen3708